MNLFALDEYNAATRLVVHRWIEARTDDLAPSLRQFPRLEVEQVRTARVTMPDGAVERVAPIRNEDGGQFNIREVVAGRFDDLRANFESVAERRAKLMVSFWQQWVERGLTEGSVTKASGPPTWDSLMDGLEKLALDFDADGEPKFKIVAGTGAAPLLERLGPRDAAQEARWQSLMARKKEERRARERQRRMA
jgi:hypothetical protein